VSAAGGHFGPARVRAARPVADAVRLLEIEPEGGPRPYPTGAHLDVAVTVGELPDVRSYSLVGEGPADGAYRIAVKRLPDSRGGSRFMHTLAEGDPIEVSAPQSHFEIQYGRPEYLLVAGGIGITPMVGMADALARHERPFRLLYAGRSSAAMPFAAELSEQLGERLELFCSDDGTRLDLATEIARLHPEGDLYVCGPLRLMDAVRAEWAAQGRPAARLRFETFGSSGRLPTEPFDVHVRELGRDVRVPGDRTMLEALRAAGVEVMWDCLRGECGLCMVDVIEAEGRLDHRDVFLSEDEQALGTKLCACVSRAAGGAVTVDTGFRPGPAR
jgi:vanillate O-demethylase ferredoxin subunit